MRLLLPLWDYHKWLLFWQHGELPSVPQWRFQLPAELRFSVFCFTDCYDEIRFTLPSFLLKHLMVDTSTWLKSMSLYECCLQHLPLALIIRTSGYTANYSITIGTSTVMVRFIFALGMPKIVLPLANHVNKGGRPYSVDIIVSFTENWTTPRRHHPATVQILSSQYPS